MYERSYGYRYDEIKDKTTTQIGAMIRHDVKQAVVEGMLPACWTYSVRTDHGTAIDVTVKDCQDAWEECTGSVDGHGCPDVWCAARNDPRYAHAARTHQVLTEEARVARMTLERIHGAYNHDGSEIQVDYFDVRYYGLVSFEDPESAEWRRKREESDRQNAEQKKAARVVGRVTNYKRDRSAVTHVLIEIPTPDGQKQTRKALACGARSWRGASVYKAADDAAVTCSRCAKYAKEHRVG